MLVITVQANIFLSGHLSKKKTPKNPTNHQMLTHSSSRGTSRPTLKTAIMYLVGINLFDLSVNKVINQFMAFLGFMHMKSDALKTVSQMTENNSCEEENEQNQPGLETGFLYTYPTRPKQWS